MKTRTHLNHALFSGLFPSDEHETHAAETVAKRDDHATGSKREYIHAAYKSCTLYIHTVPGTQMGTLALNGVGAFFWRVEPPKK